METMAIELWLEEAFPVSGCFSVIQVRREIQEHYESALDAKYC